MIRQVRPQRVVMPVARAQLGRIGASPPRPPAPRAKPPLRAVYPDARNPFALPRLLDEGLEAWTVREIWLTASPAG